MAGQGSSHHGTQKAEDNLSDIINHQYLLLVSYFLQPGPTSEAFQNLLKSYHQLGKKYLSPVPGVDASYSFQTPILRDSNSYHHGKSLCFRIFILNDLPTDLFATQINNHGYSACRTIVPLCHCLLLKTPTQS